MLIAVILLSLTLIILVGSILKYGPGIAVLLMYWAMYIEAFFEHYWKYIVGILILVSLGFFLGKL